ncbi:hypothetical protein NDU88_003264 [Pleurodeles waltl]|uniref:Uncharacterized protein n=1 Tax=Pleurodeles waltl TaxID=8319 RepID=A0AAV7UC13_PLEWA|nr:hypothetical protein NDU88_003264 [Pleurodeles waltl]
MAVRRNVAVVREGLRQKSWCREGRGGAGPPVAEAAILLSVPLWRLERRRGVGPLVGGVVGHSGLARNGSEPVSCAWPRESLSEVKARAIGWSARREEIQL